MAGLSAFTYAFNERSLIPSERFSWDEYPARIFRCALYEAFYSNTAYREIEVFARTMKHQYALSKQVRGIYNPVYRQNELLKSKIAGGAIDWESLETGALVVAMADDPLREALIQALKWSNWGVNKGLYVHQAALLGDSLLWVTDDRARQKVRIDVTHPSKIKEATFDDVGHLKRIVLEYQRGWTDPTTGKSQDVVYGLTADENEFVTTKDGQEYGWHSDMSGNPVSRWPNDYGFVPAVKAGFKDVGTAWDVNAFHASIAKIHEINDVASLLSDSIRKNIDPPWLLAGVQKPSSTPKIPGSLADGTATEDPTAQRDHQKVFYGSENARAHGMVMPIDIPGAMQHIDGLLKELERDMPELAMHRLRESGGDRPGIAIRNMYSDATGRLNEAAGNLDDALIRALQMCVSIGGMRGYENFGPFNLDSFQRGDLDFYIKPRTYFEDGFTKQERVMILSSLPDKPEQARAVLEELEYPPDKIDAIVGELATSGPTQPGDVAVQPNPAPQLPAGQGAPDADVEAEVARIMQEVMAA